MRSLPANLLGRAVREALREDIGPGDVTCAAVVPAGATARGVIQARQPLVVAGLEAARLAFLETDPRSAVSLATPSGAEVPAGTVMLNVVGDAMGILSAERTALNFLGRLSGIATLTRRCVRLVAGTRAQIYDTRKSTPGLRLLEKHAVAVGGGCNHRMGLFDDVLIKDNHLPLAGGPGAAVKAARTRYGPSMSIEIEVSDLDALEEALAAGADIVLLDNMDIGMMGEAVARVSRRFAGVARRPLLEASGGITLENLRAVAETGVDRISMGMLTHSAPAADVSLSLQPIP